MAEDLFSTRYGYRKSTDLVYEDAPETVRVGLREILANMGWKRPSEQRRIICKALRRRPDENNWSDAPINFEVDRLIHGIEWYEFYDICQRIARMDEVVDFGYINQTGLTIFEYELNKLLQEENIGYRMTDGYIDKVGSQAFEEAVGEALGNLQDPQFRAPLDQFQKALGFRNALPPDYPNAVKEAVNSVEGVLQIASGKLGASLPSMLSELQPKLPSHFERIFKGVYGYGCASEGARHSGVGGPVPSAEDAEFIIHCSSAAIRYIIANWPPRTN